MRDRRKAKTEFDSIIIRDAGMKDETKGDGYE
jgi:hypothetical protein